MQPKFECNGEWSGYTIHEAATGFVINFWSLIQGARDGLRILVPFSPQFPRGIDLTGEWNEHMSNGLAVAEIGRSEQGARILRNGHIVR